MEVWEVISLIKSILSEDLKISNYFSLKDRSIHLKTEGLISILMKSFNFHNESLQLDQFKRPDSRISHFKFVDSDSRLGQVF